MELHGQRILVTGATGFIGGAVARRLLSEGHTVRAMARQPEKAAGLAALGAEVVMGDLGDEDLLERAAQGCPVVIHCAAQVSQVDTRTGFEGPNVAGTENVLVACGKSGVKRFVFLSSISVFGLPAAGVITDDSPRGLAGEAYSDSKYGAEEAVWSFCRARGLPFTMVRPSCVYGPGSPAWSVKALKEIHKGKLLIIAGGRGTFNYVYIDNLVDAIMLVTADDRALGDAFIVNDGATTWRDFFTMYEKMAGRKGMRSVPLPVAKAGLAARNLIHHFKHKSTVAQRAINFMSGSAVFSQEHIEKKLGHRTRVSLEEGMRRTEAWFRETGLLAAA